MSKGPTLLNKANNTARRYLDIAGVIIVAIGSDGSVSLINRKGAEVLGYEEEEIIGKDWFDHFLPRRLQKETRAVFDKLMSGDVAPVEYYENPVITKSGEERLIAWHNTLLQAKDGTITGTLSSGEDITLRKQTEGLLLARMRLLEFAAGHTLYELLQKTLDEVCGLVGSPVGFYHFVEQDQKTLLLQAWSSRTINEFCSAKGNNMHYSLDEAGVWVDCVRQRRPVIHNDYASLPHRKGMPEGHAKVVRELVVPIMRKDRIVAILGVGNKPSDYTDKDAEIVSYLADVAWEIASRKSAEETLRKTADQLEQSNRELEQFAYVASHDLKEPLRTISNFTTLLGERYRGRLDSDADDFIKFIMDGTSRMEQLIDDLLVYSRVSSTKGTMTRVQSQKILVRAIADLTMLIEKNRAKIVFDTLPEVTVNPVQMETLFRNLLSNAIKFHAGEPPLIHISAEHKDDRWVFSVRDNGISIPAGQEESIFDMFRRLHGRDRYEGTGMGLAICKKIVERHGGRIWVKPEPGKGSTFYFTLPGG